MVDRLNELSARYRAARAELMAKTKDWQGTAENIPKIQISIEDLP